MNQAPRDHQQTLQAANQRQTGTLGKSGEADSAAIEAGKPFQKRTMPLSDRAST